ncbi:MULTISPECIES: AAA family ATPase [Bacillus cereus group]|uniref:AAA family ATPase n=1 Tax=Bacillus cereus group TaxID=86661 RepID=UPI00119E55B8|nr:MULTISPECIES: AAA family ATPase [Bacillus cereus group]MBK4743767.1 AAA family ATPase [Bacillus cereus]
MLLESMTLENFRQFYDKQVIYFRKPDGQKNITIIHGENGAGKTAILNAFSWCFYNKVHLQQSDKLLNEKKQLELQLGEKTSVYVTIRFRDRNRKYTVSRKQVCEKLHGENYRVIEESCDVEYINEEGKTVKSNKPQRIIDQILPQTMSSYFFFDGERIDNLSKEDSAKDIQTAVKTIMGLKMMERGREHLEKVKKIFRDELKKSDTKETEDLINELVEMEEGIEDLQKQIAEKKEHEKCIDKEIEVLDVKLKELEGAKELQEKREQFEREQEELKGQIKEINDKIISLCSEQGYLGFAESAILTTKEILDSKRKRGEIPSGIKEQFIEDLLERKKCICGQELILGTEHYNYVESWKSEAASYELESSFIQTCGNIKVLEERRKQLFIDLKRLMKDKALLNEQLREVIENIEEIGNEFENDKEDIGKIEKRRKELFDESKDVGRMIGSFDTLIQQKEERKKQLENDIKKNKAKDDKANLIKRRMEACEEAISAINEMLRIRSEYVREELQEKISEVYGRLLRKGYIAELDENYTINVYKPFGNGRKLVDMSTGERQITSLAFLGALVDTARKQEETGRKNELFTGGIIPIVMDSPFGSLDEDHQGRIAEGIPSLAHQIIVLVSSSQWRGIKGRISQFVGREYKLNYFATSNDLNISHEYTEIEEVQNYATTY